MKNISIASLVLVGGASGIRQHHHPHRQKWALSTGARQTQCCLVYTWPWQICSHVDQGASLSSGQINLSFVSFRVHSFPWLPIFYSLRLFQKFDTFRILVCGGDGSVGWVLSEIDSLNLHKQVPQLSDTRL